MTGKAKAKNIVFVPGMFSVGDKVFINYLKIAEERGYESRAVNLWRDEKNNFARLGEIGLADYVFDVEKQVEHFFPDEPYIIAGHSLGGLLSLLAANLGVIKPQAIILFNSAAPRGIPGLTSSVIWTFSDILKETLWRNQPAKINFNKAKYALFNLMPENKHLSTFRTLVPESSRVIEQVGLWFLDFKKFSKVNGKNIKCDILVIGAKQDRMTPVSVIRKIHHKLRKGVVPFFRVDYKEFSNHAHWVLAEPGWEDVINYALNWLENPVK